MCVYILLLYILILFFSFLVSKIPPYLRGNGEIPHKIRVFLTGGYLRITPGTPGEPPVIRQWFP